MIFYEIVIILVRHSVQASFDAHQFLRNVVKRETAFSSLVIQGVQVVFSMNWHGVKCDQCILTALVK